MDERQIMICFAAAVQFLGAGMFLLRPYFFKDKTRYPALKGPALILIFWGCLMLIIAFK